MFLNLHLPNQSTGRVRAKIGVLVPYTNTNIEPDMAALAPAGVSVHVTRIGGYPAQDVPGLDEMKSMASTSLDDAARLLMGMRPDLVLYGCTSATLAIGVDGDAAFAEDLSRVTNCPTLTTSGSIVASLNRIQARRISFVTPYDGPMTQAGADFLTGAGFEITAQTYPETALTSLQQGELTPDHIIEMIGAKDHQGADALVLSCTDMRAVECIVRLERALDLPVISSNQALFHEAMLHLNLPVTGIPGRLAQIN
jgi:maleate isomerase